MESKKGKLKYFFFGTAWGVFLVVVFLGGAVAERIWRLPLLDKIFPSSANTAPLPGKVKVVSEESVVTKVVEKAAPSVVTVSISKTTTVIDEDLFHLFFFPFNWFTPKKKKIEQDIGTGFVVDSKECLIVTNKHVVSDREAKYKVITRDDKVFPVKKIFRDPGNDLAILKIENCHLPALELGDSDNLKVGQLAIAIGTALGEFRHTVTVGVISGLGRGITAGSPYEGVVEKLDNVIQTDAAINPGNSGGPLLNSAGQVVGVNVAVAREGENIGFAIPINVVKESLKNFRATGEFNRPFLGVRYRMISKKAALLNEVPYGAYVVEVIEGSPAEKAGIEKGDIITHVDGERIGERGKDLAKLINKKKVGDEVKVKVWREGKEVNLKVVLEERQQE
ncbi:trypsin-like peptidase domain-containing protein [bacterium]|nr:trypsin-like peptidase domain-containing protein [bacterium]